METTRKCAIVALFLLLGAGCSRAPSPSHVGTAYQGKLRDDILVEAATTVLVTSKDVVIALDCTPLRDAIANGDASRIEQAVASGGATRLPAGVTIYTMPFSPANPGASPLVVTDDKYAGKLCTPNAYTIVKS
ncbi:MAG: hypothetical protein WB615_09835 [Candidatus Tumulicola sp.]